MNLKRFVISLLFVIFDVLVCIRWVDGPVALLLDKHMPQVIASHEAAVPDLLLPVTLAISAASWTGYAWLTFRKSKSPLRPIFGQIGFASLLLFAAKDALQLFCRSKPKAMAGRHGPCPIPISHDDGVPGAFPSGHMSVFTPVFIALYRIFPWLRNWWISLWVALALALVAGNYHFVSDVIAGAYLGYVINFLALYLALRLVKSTGRP